MWSTSPGLVRLCDKSGASEPNIVYHEFSWPALVTEQACAEDEMMEYTMLPTDPFSILTIVVAPAVLTNASSVLALGTNNRLARVADRTHAVTAQLAGARDHEIWAAQLPDLQTRAQLLLRALRCFYLGLGLFASSALISIAGSIVVYYGGGGGAPAARSGRGQC